MIDIVGLANNDIQLYDTQTEKAANILSVQVGTLEYQQDLGIDLTYFLQNDIQFQNESFRAYLVEVLANQGINVSNVGEVLNDLSSTYVINISSEETSTSLVAR